MFLNQEASGRDSITDYRHIRFSVATKRSDLQTDFVLEAEVVEEDWNYCSENRSAGFPYSKLKEHGRTLYRITKKDILVTLESSLHASLVLDTRSC